MNCIRWVWIYRCISTEGSIQLADLAQMHLWDCIECVPFDTAWHWPGLQSPINCISDALGWLLRSHHRVSPPCFNLRQDEGSRSWWDQKVQRWMWHVRSCQITQVPGSCVFVDKLFVMRCRCNGNITERTEYDERSRAGSQNYHNTFMIFCWFCWLLTGWGYSASNRSCLSVFWFINATVRST